MCRVKSIICMYVYVCMYMARLTACIVTHDALRAPTFRAQGSRVVYFLLTSECVRMEVEEREKKEKEREKQEQQKITEREAAERIKGWYFFPLGF